MSIPLSRRQRKVLRKGYFIPYPYDEFGESDRKICDELCNSGFMEMVGIAVITTEKGNALLQNGFSTWLWRIIPIAISIAAVIISIVK